MIQDDYSKKNMWNPHEEFLHVTTQKRSNKFCSDKIRLIKPTTLTLVLFFEWVDRCEIDIR